jgi:signal transduction histidine kinase
MNKKIQIVLLLLLICIVDGTYAQQAKVDSLENLLKAHKTEDTVRINLLNKIAFLIYKENANKANSYATQAGELSDKIIFLKGKAESLWVIGSSLSFYKSDKLALDYFLKALKIAEEINFKPGIVKYLIASGFNYAATGNITAATECYEKAKRIANELNDKSSIAKCILRMCVIYTGQGDYNKAIEEYQKLIPFCEKIKNTEILSSALNNMGAIQEYQGNYSEALEYYQKSLKIKEANNDKGGIIYGYVNISSIIATQANYKKAFEYLNKALKIAEELNDKRKISLCYESMGDVYLKMNNRQALDYLQKALVIAEELSYTTPMLTISSKIGDFYRVQGNYEKALEYYKKALGLSEEMKRKRTICETWSKIGAVYLAQKAYSTALSYTLKSLEIANELKLLNNQKDIHSQLSEIYSATNDYKNAYKHQKFFKQLSDSIYNEKNVRKIAELEYSYKYEKEKQATELKQQQKDAIQAAEKKQQQIIILSLIVGLILMFSLAVFVYRSYRLKHKTNLILTEQKQEIESKNDELLQLNEEILAQKDEITTINAEIELKNSKLQELNATKDKFFGIIAHDLKNPFNAILGFSNLLITSNNQYNQGQTMEIIGMMHTSAKNAYKLLENLLEWSRSQTGAIDYKPENLILKEFVIENENLCENLAKEKNISISNEIPEDLVVCADQYMLSTILRNLITNAIKFTHKGGNITITSILQDAAITIAVCDTGIGMDEYTRNKLFKINEKISIVGTEQERGTGLGLLLCKEFVEKHGGKIWVESELYRGSNFKFSIPFKHENNEL